MNPTEKEFYDQFITPKIESGEIVKCRFEDVTFRLADAPDLKQKTTYTPDFWLQYKDGSVSIYETKGSFYHEDARVKYKIAADQYEEFDWYWVEIKGKKIVKILKWQSESTS